MSPVVGQWLTIGSLSTREMTLSLPAILLTFASPLRTRYLVTQEGHSHLSRGAWDEKSNDDDVNDDDNYLNALYEELDLPS